MRNSNRNALLVIGAIFVGVIAGLILASNLELTRNSVASQNDKETVVLGSASEPLSASNDLINLENAFVKVAEEVKPSVVTISSAKIIK